MSHNYCILFISNVSVVKTGRFEQISLEGDMSHYLANPGEVGENTRFWTKLQKWESR